jgi:2'-5' RNA ligase
MKFMGEFDMGHIDSLHSRLATACVDLKPFTLTTSGIGVFPARGNPRVIWYGIENQPSLERLAEIIENSCAHYGYAREKRPFSPHITIGRVRRTARVEDLRTIRQLLAGFRLKSGNAFTVTTLHLIRSTLTPAGPIYHDLFHIPLT